MAPPVSKPSVDGKPKLLDQVRQVLRLRHYSLRAEVVYLDRQVATSTQDQVLSALLFLYKEILQHEIAFIGGVVRVKRLPKPPVGSRLRHGPLPGALARKMPSACRDWAWQYLFPAQERSLDRTLASNNGIMWARKIDKCRQSSGAHGAAQ